MEDEKLKFADLSPEQLKAVNELEQKLGITLVAYEYLSS